MATNQPLLPEGEDKILTQVQAYKLMGVTRAVLRGFIDRGELPAADENGVRGAARVRQSDVLGLMERRGMKAKVPLIASGKEPCRNCEVLREQMRRMREEHDRRERVMNAALSAALRTV